ncbi:oxidoreductase FAD-binding protein [Aspergillus heteromorphus CBS 117.55]|uniref:Oxidoreductase FAD-binding protein n=1 Tax=Aspergillus heteromorphus CBS 117.55 TaxID=1448321 RepID=A0A317VWY6_9EURO|nr:oxidoreductase FAD-binding protein [Aspergillus heteromorphus CBS 117.55]PWY78285.1 oxidoreductase FAD-binding protein [Aspergillus heteromorphus CBS 117.55]
MPLLTETIPFHDGEKKMHNLMHVPPQDNPTVPSLSYGAGYLLRKAPLLAIGTVDDQGRPWTTVWGGEEGFANPVAESTMEVHTPVDRCHDPVVGTLLRDSAEHDGKIWSGLIVDLEARKRAKLHGRQISGTLDSGAKGSVPGLGMAHLSLHIDASLGNCPKYMNRKHIIPALPAPKLISDSPQLSSEAIDLLHRADCLFVSSTHSNTDMDTNIRGGPPGFVRVVSNEPSGAVFAYPEYSGNRLYQTLGNLQTNPSAGYVFPDFETGNALYVTGQTQILVGRDAAHVLPRSNLAVLVTVTAARYVERSLSFRGIAGEPSPYNPSVRYLATEKVDPTVSTNEDSTITATLIKKEVLTPNIQRFRFRVSEPKKLGTWTPGQYATLSFYDELYMGYHHMQDDDPSSLNDDYVRTFTISSHPQHLPASEFEITARKHGNVTNYLFRINQRSGLEVPLKGTGGEFHIQQGANEIVPFIAGGIGITPVLAHLPALDLSRLRLLWSISIQDMGLALDTFQRFPELPHSTTLFVTGADSQDTDVVRQYEAVRSSGACVRRRRMESSDLDLELAEVWYFCGSPALKGPVLSWLTGKNVVYEDFNY